MYCIAVSARDIKTAVFQFNFKRVPSNTAAAACERKLGQFKCIQHTAVCANGIECIFRNGA